MRIVFHLGAHCTDEERLVRCLYGNRAQLGAQGIAVPDPTRYRKLLRDTAAQLRGSEASAETQTLVLASILDAGETAERLILSWDNFLSFPQWALRGTIYAFAGERIRAYSNVFPKAQAEFHLAIRNPATFLPALFEKQKIKTYEEFIEGTDPMSLRWSDVIAQIRAQNPTSPLTVWCDEDTPLIWPEVLQAVSQHAPGTRLEGADELLSVIMAPEGLARMQGYLSSHPPESVAQRRRIVAAFLDKFARADRVEMEVDLPGWTEDSLAAMNATYRDDIARIAAMPGVTLITA